MKTTRQIKREAKQLYRLCLVNGLLDEARARLVVQRVILEKRRGSLALLSYFQRWVKLDFARHTAQVESAVLLPEELRVSVQTGLARTYVTGITASIAQNPELIGAMRIKLGIDVYDGSVRARLAALEKGF